MPPGGSHRYSAVLGNDESWKTRLLIDQYCIIGVHDFKVKLGGDLAVDRETLRSIAELTRWHGMKDYRLRVDANNLWADEPARSSTNSETGTSRTSGCPTSVSRPTSAGRDRWCTGAGVSRAPSGQVQLALARILPWKHSPGTPTIGTTLLRSMLVGADSTRQRLLRKKLADVYINVGMSGVGLLEFDAIELIQQLGYEQGLEALQTWLDGKDEVWRLAISKPARHAATPGNSDHQARRCPP